MLIIAAFALPAFAQKLDTFGYYTIKRPTKDFADISEIHLSGDYGAEQKPPVYGLIRLKKKSAKDYRLLKPTVKGRTVSFTTRTVAGVYYKFTGAFTKLFDDLKNEVQGTPTGGTALQGTLVKYRGKKKIAQALVKCTYFGGD